MRKSHSLAALIAALLFLSGVSLTSVAKAEPSVPQDCVVTDEYGSQTWIGELPDPVRAVGNALQEFADSYPHVATGVAYCSHYEAVTIYVKHHDPTINERVTELRAEHPQTPIYVEEVGASQKEIARAIDSIDLTSESAADIVAVAPDPAIGGIEVSLDSAVSSPEHRFDSETQRLQSSPPEDLGLEEVAVPIRLVPGSSVDTTATRRSDQAPFGMGAQITSNTGNICSLGTPIVINGRRMVVTAGHCQGTRFTNNGRFVGNTHTTSWPGNASKYGDWKILTGSQYAYGTFHGALSTTYAMPISAWTTNGRAKGEQICSSGRTTATICRYIIEATGVKTKTSDGVEVSHQMRMHHDDNLDGLKDSNGFQSGDSGGPCYFSTDGGNTATVAGIIQGTTPVQGLYQKRYFCTTLGGIKAWDASVKLR